MLKISLTILLFWLVLRQVDIESAIGLFLSSNYVLLTVATLVLVLLMIPATFRWSYVLQTLGLPLPIRQLLQWNFAAGFFNNILPTGIGGDVLRAEWCRRSGMSVASALETVVIDRLVAFLCLLILIMVSLPFAAHRIERPDPELLVWPAMIVTGLAGGAVLLFLLNRLKVRGVQFLLRMLKRAVKAVTNPAAGSKMMANGIATHILRVVGIWLIARSLHIDITLTVCLPLIPAALLLAMIPVTIGGWGLREGVFVLVLSLVSVTPVEATTLSVIYGLANLVSSIPGAGAWIVLRHHVPAG